MSNANIVTLENLQKDIATETGVRLKPNDFFLHKLYDGFTANSWQLKTPQQQKTAVYAVSSAIAKCAAAGIDFVKDFDLITPVFRGGIPSITIDIKALPRLLARKGWIYQDALIAIPTGGKGQFEETIANGRRIIVFNHNGDHQPVINVTNLTNDSIERFAIRISVGRNPGEMMDFFDYVPTSEVIAAANASEAGIYVVKWESYKDDKGYNKKRRVISKDDDGNPILSTKDSPWQSFTSTMVKKVCIRRVQNTIKETFPEIGAIMENLDQSDTASAPVPVDKIEEVIDTPFDFNAPNQEQSDIIRDAMATYKANPNILLTDIEKIYKETPDMDESTTDDARAKIKSELIEKHFATLYIAMRQTALTTKYPELINVVKWLWEA